MRPTTLCFIINDKKEILLGRKKRGLGAGKPNGLAASGKMVKHSVNVRCANCLRKRPCWLSRKTWNR